jgi:hypothetical protein
MPAPKASGGKLRHIKVPFDIRLDRLHLAIQAAMGWTNGHLYEIRASDVGWSTPLPDVDGAGDFLDARKARLDDLLEDIGTKTLRYIYDFGTTGMGESGGIDSFLEDGRARTHRIETHVGRRSASMR